MLCKHKMLLDTRVSGAKPAAGHRTEEQAGTVRKESGVSPIAALIHTPQECFLSPVFSTTSLKLHPHDQLRYPSVSPGAQLLHS